MAIPSKKPSGIERKRREPKTAPEECFFRIFDCEGVRHGFLPLASDLRCGDLLDSAGRLNYADFVRKDP
ncbi:hypothetical protein HMPREF1986_00739 [Oribacterium sp. oral taxon 078 str. F0263]|nr:hypothetical protein HMPREF1986_00739 [Oribacterium sp. oral taxon 078 str. F0263]